MELNKSKAIAAGVLALTLTVGSGALVAGNVNAAAAVQKIVGHFGGKGAVKATLESAELTTLLGLTADQLKTELQSGKSLAAIAGEKNVDVQKVIDLEVKLLTAALDQQLKDGKITQAQYDTQKATIADKAKELVNATRIGKGDRDGKGGFGHHEFEAAVLTNADLAKLLGLTVEEMGTQLKAGKSLAALAAEKNIAVQSVIDMETKAITAALDQQLKDGKLTQAQYDSAKANVTTWATEVVNDTFVGKPGGGRGGPVEKSALLEDADLAKLYGLTTAELKTALQSGKSLAELATEKNVALTSVTAQVAKTLTAALDKELADKTITQAQYDEKKAGLATEVTKIVNGKPGGKGGPGGGKGGRGHGKGGPGMRG